MKFTCEFCGDEFVRKPGRLRSLLCSKTCRARAASTIFVLPTGRNKWSAEIKVAYRKIKLGCFTVEREAALAYDAAALQHFGEFARPNFPVEARAS